MLDRYASQDYCSSLDSRSFLVEIRNEEIETFLKSQDVFADDFWWIGAMYDTEVTVFLYSLLSQL